MLFLGVELEYIIFVREAMIAIKVNPANNKKDGLIYSNSLVISNHQIVS